MLSKSSLVALMIVVACLVHSELEAMEPKPVDSSLTLATTDSKGSPGKNGYRAKPKNGFLKGTQSWQAYASAAAGDQGKGEMYALHLGYGYFFLDYLAVNIDVLGAYIRSGIDDNGYAAGLDVIFRRHFSWVDDDPWSVYLDIGGGLQQQSTHFSGSRHFNFRVMGGGGGTIRVADRVRLLGGIRYLHISDAGIEGGGGGFDGFMFYAGAMFPF